MRWLDPRAMWLNPFSVFPLMRQARAGKLRADDAADSIEHPSNEEMAANDTAIQEFVARRAGRPPAPLSLLAFLVFHCYKWRAIRLTIVSLLFICFATASQFAFAQLMAVLAANPDDLLFSDTLPSMASSVLFFCFSGLLCSYFSYQTTLSAMVIGNRIRMQIIWSVQSASLRATQATAGPFPVAEVVSLAGIDAMAVEWFVWYMPYLFTSPIEAGVCFALSCLTVGATVASLSLAAFIIYFGIKLLLMRRAAGQQEEARVINAERFGLLSEAITANAVVKLTGVDDMMLEGLKRMRAREERRLGWMAASNAASILITISLAPVMAWLSMIGSYTFSDTISSSSIMTVLGYYRTIVTEDTYNILLSLQDMGMARTACTQFYTLMAATAGPATVRSDPATNGSDEDSSWSDEKKGVAEDDITDDAVLAELQGASFSWDDADAAPTLRDLTLEIPRGQVIGVAGPMGCGKSSMLLALLGELRLLPDGTLRRHPDWRLPVAYAAQKPWLQTGTVRENICFAPPALEERQDSAFGAMPAGDWLSHVVACCGLQADLDGFKDGLGLDHPVGESGSALSGGQRARVALARAVYARAGITLLDDPLCALDPTAGDTIFKALAGPSGLLRGDGRSVVFVTTSPAHLSLCDVVVALESGGTWKSVGPYSAAVANAAVSVDAKKMSLQRTHTAPVPLRGSAALARVSALPIDTMGMPMGHRAQMIEDYVQFDNEFDVDDVIDDSSEEERSEAEGEAVVTGVDVRQRPPVSAMVFMLGWWGLLSGGLLLVAAQGVVFYWQFVLQDWLDSDSALTGEQQAAEFDSLAKKSLYLLIPMTWCAIIGATLHFFFFLRGSTRLQARCARSVISSPYSFFSANPAARVHANIAQDSQEVEYELSVSTVGIWSMGAQLVGTAVVSIISLWYLVFLFLPLMAVMWAVERLYAQSVVPMAELEAKTRGPVMATVASSRNGLPTVHAFRREGAMTAKLAAAVRRHRGASQSVVHTMSWLTFMADVVIYNSVAIIVAVLIGIIFTPGPDSLGPLVLSNIVSISGVIGATALLVSDAETSLTALQRLVMFAELPSEDSVLRGQGSDGKGSGDKSACDVEAATEISLIEPPKEWPATGLIEFRHAYASYTPTAPPALIDVSIVIPAGSSCALVGRSGSGKSTAFLALTGMIPVVGGAVVIDGVDVGRVALRTLRAAVAVVPQEPVLFSGGLRTNLDPFGRHADEETLWEALRAVGMAETVNDLGGLDADVVAAGVSQGLRQLLCLARALLRDSTVLLLDEANASVDRETETKMTATIAAFAAGKLAVAGPPRRRTVVEVAHRLDGVMGMDQVCVLGAGAVLEVGVPRELAKKAGGEFAGMLNSGH